MQAWPLSELPEDWAAACAPHLDLAAMRRLQHFLAEEEARAAQEGFRIFPPRNEIFAALQHTPFAKLRCVILGQDPYHGEGQAHGLAFSVREGVKIPSSLRNIFHELRSDLGHAPPPHGCLTDWANRGVLLLNTVLTVRENQANSHANQGWEVFTDAVIAAAKAHPTPIAFLLWGKPAERKAGLIDETRHLVLRSSHPSGLSARRTDAPFIGSRCFSRTNAFLTSQGLAGIF